jgi:Ser/Thr protein kinase RdoA (MazF antagonist)
VNAAAQHPFARLTPEVVLDALSGVGLPVDGRLMGLNSYENRVYQAMLDEGEPVVAKFYRPMRWSEAQIREEHTFSAELSVEDIPVVSPSVLQGDTLHPLRVGSEDGSAMDFWFSVCPRRGGRRPELDDPEVLEWIGRFLARIHQVGARRPFEHRPALTLQSHGVEPLELLLKHHVPDDIRNAWQRTAVTALSLVEQALSEPYQVLRLHGDAHPGNILWTPVEMPQGGPHFVDLDDARMGPAVQDLWMLPSGDRRERTLQWAALLDGYTSMRPFETRELLLVEPLRTLRLIHYSAWLAQRKDDPAFAEHFGWFGTPAYWQEQVRILHDQVEAMQEDPLML